MNVILQSRSASKSVGKGVTVSLSGWLGLEELGIHSDGMVQYVKVRNHGLPDSELQFSLEL